MLIQSKDLLIKSVQNKTITIQTKQIEISSTDILNFLSPHEINSHCKAGCPNYYKKWTCPPKCPSFEDYTQGFSKIKLFLFYTSPHQFNFLQKQERAMAAYNFTKDELQKYLREQENTNSKMIAANSCQICNPCALSLGKNCYFPQKMRFNLVAFGFNVSEIMTDLFHHQLIWAEENKVPEYVSCLGAILSR